MQDPRPYVGEPLALDLLNTQWMSVDGPQDLLTNAAGLRCWLTTNRLNDRCHADENTRHATFVARQAIRQAVTGGSASDLNAVLDHGRIRRTLSESGPTDVVEVPQSEWLPGWLAADNLLHLLSGAPHRIKQCAHPRCVLWFYDTSKNSTRCWHSMAVCGNRSKVARYYATKKR